MDTPPTDPAASDLSWVTLLLQTSDALFPTGAYAHSLGFEEAVRLGLVRDEDTLRAFLTGHVAAALATFEMPYLRFAHHAARAADLSTLAELDAEVGAAKLAWEAREASAQLGVRRLKALCNILPADPLLSACAEAITAGRMAGHQAVIWGVQAAVAGVPLEAALGAYYYQAVAAVGGASLKLIRIGQEGVQRALRAGTPPRRSRARCR